MPSVSGKQHRFMAAVANNPKFAKKAGVPQSVGEEFMRADKKRKFRDGGTAAEPDSDIAKSVQDVGRVMYQRWLDEQKQPLQMTSPKKPASEKQVFMTSGKEDKKTLSNRSSVGSMPSKASGGNVKESKAMMKKEVGFMKKAGAPKSMIKHEMKEAGMKMKKMAGGGLAAGHKQADGIAKKGKTKAMQVKMAKGGKAGGGMC